MFDRLMPLAPAARAQVGPSLSNISPAKTQRPQRKLSSWPAFGAWREKFLVRKRNRSSRRSAAKYLATMHFRSLRRTGCSASHLRRDLHQPAAAKKGLVERSPCPGGRNVSPCRFRLRERDGEKRPELLFNRQVFTPPWRNLCDPAEADDRPAATPPPPFRKGEKKNRGVGRFAGDYQRSRSWPRPRPPPL